MDKFYKESKISIFGGKFSSSSSSNSDAYYYDKDDYDDDDSDSYYIFANCGVGEYNAIDQVIKNEAFCFDICNFSEKLVDATIVEAQKHLEKKSTKMVGDIIQPLVQELVSSALALGSAISHSSSGRQPKLLPSKQISTQSIDWPKISEFNIKLGLEKLEDYVATWHRANDWLYCVEFLGFESEECSNIFVYEVEWSKPTNEYPIPQATACVYFALEVLKMVPYNHDRSIEVTYVFETSNFIHTPGKINFQEKWLDAIIYSKLRILKTLVFSVG